MSTINGSDVEEDPEVITIEDSENDITLVEDPASGQGPEVILVDDSDDDIQMIMEDVVAHPVFVDEVDDEVIVVEAEKAKTPIVEPMPGPSSAKKPKTDFQLWYDARWRSGNTQRGQGVVWQPVGALHTAVPRSTSEQDPVAGPSGQHPVAGPSGWVPNMDFLRTPVFGSKEWKLARAEKAEEERLYLENNPDLVFSDVEESHGGNTSTESEFSIHSHQGMTDSGQGQSLTSDEAGPESPNHFNGSKKP